MHDDVVARLPVDALRDEAQAKRCRPDQCDLAQLRAEQIGGELAGVAQQVCRHKILLVATGAGGGVIAHGIARAGWQRADSGVGEVGGFPGDREFAQSQRLISLDLFYRHLDLEN